MHTCLLVAGLALATSGVALAEGTDKKPSASAPAAGAAAPTAGAAPAGEMPPPPKPGPETEALKPFARNMTWTGKVPANAYGNNPEMPSKGKITCKWEVNNLVAACDIESTAGTGKQAMTWKAHMLQGWDFKAKGYRQAMYDSAGTFTNLKGTLEGNKLVWESDEVTLMGQKSKVRISFDNTDPKAVKMVGEHIVNGKWIVDEEDTMKASGK
jgi:hypothetical protein